MRVLDGTACHKIYVVRLHTLPVTAVAVAVMTLVLQLFALNGYTAVMNDANRIEYITSHHIQYV